MRALQRVTWSRVRLTEEFIGVFNSTLSLPQYLMTATEVESNGLDQLSSRVSDERITIGRSRAGLQQARIERHDTGVAVQEEMRAVEQCCAVLRYCQCCRDEFMNCENEWFRISRVGLCTCTL